MAEIVYRKRSILLTDEHIAIVDKLRSMHDREFSAEVRVIISEAGRRAEGLEPAAAAKR